MSVIMRTQAQSLLMFTFMSLTFAKARAIMETKKGENVSSVRNKIIAESISSLRREGLKFSVDTLAERLKISKKTVYKYFPDKEALALALYEKYYGDAARLAGELMGNENSAPADLLRLYFDSKTMIRSEIFNKYKLNGSIYSYAAGQNDALWSMLAPAFSRGKSKAETETFRVIVDSSFEKLADSRLAPDAVIEMLVRLI